MTMDEPLDKTGYPYWDNQIAVGNYALTKTFTDFVLCDNTMMGVFNWSRTTSGGNSTYAVSTATSPGAAQLQRFQSLTRQQGFLPWW